MKTSQLENFNLSHHHCHFAVFGDIHGRLALMYTIAMLWQQESGSKVAALLQVGDMGAFPEPSKVDEATKKCAKKDSDELEFKNFCEYTSESKFYLGREDSPFTYFIRGNHEDFNYLASFSNPSTVDPWQKIFFIPDGYTVNIIDKDSLTLESFLIGGFGGIPPSQEQRMRGKIARMKYRKAKQNTCYDLRFFNESYIRLAFDGLEKVDILLTHAGPKCSALPEGSVLISELAERVKPRVHLFGHHHKVVAPCRGPGNSLLVGLEHLKFSDSGELKQGSWGILSINKESTEFLFPSPENFEFLRMLRHCNYRSLLTPGTATPTTNCLALPDRATEYWRSLVK